MTDKPTPTDAELKAMWQIHAADIGGIFDYARAVLEKWGQPAQAAEPVAWWIPKAEQFALADKSGDRPFAKAWEPLYAAPQPVAREPLSAAQKQHIHNETGAGHALICLVESYLLDAHGIKGDQHV